MQKKTIEKIIKSLIYATFFVPLVVLPSSFIFPFIVPKILLLRTLILGAIALYSLLLVINWHEYKPKFTYISFAVFGFFISFTLSTFLGTDPYHSFWDNHERMLGLFTIFHYIAFFIISSQTFKSWMEWRNALRVFLVAGSLAMIVGVLQVFNPNLLLNGGSSRVISTLGNPIYVGGYGLFLFFSASLLILKENDKWWRIAEAIMSFFALLGLWYSGTRGTLLGLMVGLIVSVVAYIFVLQNYPKTRKVLISIIGFGALLLLVAFAARSTSFIKNSTVLSRLFNTSISEITSGPRIIAWNVAIDSWKEHPVIGWGPNNFFYAFNTHYNPRSLEFGYGETWFDNAHNILLNTLAVQGIIGLTFYLSIFGAALYVLYASYKAKKIDMHLLIISASFLVAHLVQNITVFENPTSYLYFMFWLAMVSSLTRNVKQNEFGSEAVYRNRNISTTTAVTALAFTFILIFIFNIQPARANMKTLKAMQNLGANPVAAIPSVKEALSFKSPHIDDIRNDISRTIISAVSNRQIGKESRGQLLIIAQNALLDNLALHPLDIRSHLSLSQLLQNEAVQSNDVRMMTEAEKYLVEAYNLSPKRQQVIYSLAIVKIQLGKNDEAKNLLTQAINDNPKIGESYMRLAYFYDYLKQPNKVMETIVLSKNNGAVFSPEEQASVNELIASISSTKK